jgi:hypothetical protein
LPANEELYPKPKIEIGYGNVGQLQNYDKTAILQLDSGSESLTSTLSVAYVLLKLFATIRLISLQSPQRLQAEIHVRRRRSPLLIAAPIVAPVSISRLLPPGDVDLLFHFPTYPLRAGNKLLPVDVSS